MVPLFKSLVRPILEYANSVWANNSRKNIDSIEHVQRFFTRCIIEVKELSYEDRLKSLNLPSLEFRRFRGDLIETYKITHEIYDVTTTKTLFTYSENNNNLRGHNYKLEKIRTNKSTFRSFFTNRVVNTWNKLPADIVNSTTLNSFKNKVDKLYKDKMFLINANFYD